MNFVIYFISGNPKTIKEIDYAQKDIEKAPPFINSVPQALNKDSILMSYEFLQNDINLKDIDGLGQYRKNINRLY